MPTLICLKGCIRFPIDPPFFSLKDTYLLSYWPSFVSSVMYPFCRPWCDPTASPPTHTQKPEERPKNADGKLERKDTVAYTEYGAKGKVTPYLMKKLKTLQASIYVFSICPQSLSCISYLSYSVFWSTCIYCCDVRQTNSFLTTSRRCGRMLTTILVARAIAQGNDLQRGRAWFVCVVWCLVWWLSGWGGAACFEIKALHYLKCLRFANIELQVCRLRKFEGLNVWVSEHTPNLSFWHVWFILHTCNLGFWTCRTLEV